MGGSQIKEDAWVREWWDESDNQTWVGKHVYTRNGVLTDVKSFGTVQLGYASTVSCITSTRKTVCSAGCWSSTETSSPGWNILEKKILSYLSKCIKLWVMIKRTKAMKNQTQPMKCKMAV
nr:MATH and LRR domain-containing protein PFE0570w [Ipomoea batatas]